MGEKINVYIEVADESLKEKLYHMLSDDWSIQWHFISRDENRLEPEVVNIAVVDGTVKLKTIAKGASIIYLGQADDDSSYFTTIETPSPESVFKAIKRAYSFREITKQNVESTYEERQNKNSLESIAQSLSMRVHQLMKQSEMRIALVDQLPVGVLGIDDEATIVLANPKAIEVLSVEDIPIWGLSLEALLSEKVGEFVKNGDASEIIIERYGEKIVLRKSSFILDESYAGTILVLWKPEEYKKEGKN